MKEIFDNDINNIDETQMNLLDDIGLDDMGIGLSNTLHVNVLDESMDVNKSEEVVYKNLEEVKTNSHMYKNIDSESLVDVNKLEDSVGLDDVNAELDNAILDDVKPNNEELEININEDNENEVADDKYVVDGDVEQKGPIIGYKFVDVEENEKETISGKIEEVIVKETDFISEDIAPYISKGESSTKKRKIKDSECDNHKKLIRRIGIIAALFAVISTSVLLVVKSIANKINFTDFSDTVEQEEQFDTESVLSDNAEVVKVNEFNWDMIKGNPTYDENIYNILIVGGDIAGTKDARGNSDTLIIVSIDKNTKSIKLSSIMRDTYVPIPGYSDNKINSAYATGGVPLVKQVIEENFKVTIDSTVVVNYTTFVKAIDKLGGVKGVVLNGSEARFINRECNKHGYSSNLVEGTHDLNAYQALHFARIRKISSDIYGSDDFGRTARQRYVINQLFKQYKDLNYAQLAGVLTSVMGELEVDEVLKKDLFLLAQVALKFNAETLAEFRLPMDDAYSFASVPVPGSGQNMSVVKIDDYWQTNVDALHQFIYGTTEY